jgi:hypothetical protein
MTSLQLQPIEEDTAALRTEGEGVLSKANLLAVVDQETLLSANGMGSDVAAMLKSIEKRRKFFVEPLNAHVKSVNALFASLSEPLKRADQILRHKILEWRAAEQKKIDDARRAAEAAAREEQRKAEEKAQAAATAKAAGENRKAAQLGRSAMHAQAKAESVAAGAAALAVVSVPKSMDAGGLEKNKTSTVWKFQVVDPQLVPREYLVVSDAHVREAVRSGAREIPGVRIYQEEQIAFASRR